MQRVIDVVEHDPGWKVQFEVEAAIWRRLIGHDVVAIHHVGSTAIPRICAKPIIDLLVVVRDIERVDEFNEELTSRGYIPRGEYGIPGRRFFIKGTQTHRTHHIHVYEAGSPEIARHVEFRDYLNAHPEEAQEYSRLKEALANAYRHNIEAYMAGKDEFIKEVQERARIWAEKAHQTE